jgi:flagellar hook-associated protein 1
VANASVPGYHRQEAVLRAGPTQGAPGLYASTLSGKIGTGVILTQVRRFNMDFIDSRYRGELSQSNQWQIADTYLKQVEATLAETGNDSMMNKLDAFWSSWKGVATDPEDMALRSDLLQKGRDLANAFNGRIENLNTIQRDMNYEIQQRVDEINTMAEKVAKLNTEIGRYTGPSMQPNDFLDEQARYIDRFAEIAGATVYTENNGQVMVSIGGHVLVQGGTASKLVTTEDPTNYNYYKVYWQDDNQTLNAPTGEMAGLVDVRDRVIKNDIDRLNTLAATVFTQVNALHSQGYGLNDTVAHDPAGTPPVVGRDFFTLNPNTTYGATTFANSIRVNSQLEDVANIAAAKNLGAKGDGSNAEDMFRFQTTNVAFYVGNPAYDGTNSPTIADPTITSYSMNNYNNMRVTEMGLEVNKANSLSTQHKNLADVMAKQRESVTGVSLDEEAANLMKYQRSYQASVRVMTAVDEMLDRVINGMGTVGL